MVRLPDASDLGVREPQASQRSIDVPRSPLGGAIAGFGAALQDAGDAMARQAKVREAESAQARRFGLDSNLMQLEDQWRTNLIDSSEREKNGASGFTARKLKEYDATARKFLEGVSREDRREYDQKLYLLRSRISEQADTFERRERDRYTGERLTVGKNAALNRVRDNPEAWASARQEVLDMIDKSSWPEWRKAEERAKWPAELGKGFYEAHPERGLKDLAPGASNAASAKTFLRSYLTGDKDADHIEGMGNNLATGLAGLIRNAPPEIGEGLRVFSGYRSSERQAQLFRQAVAKYGSVAAARRWVAPPGRSQHNHGNAADLQWNGMRLDKAPKHVRDWVHANAGKYGLNFRLAHEPWHVEAGKAGRIPTTYARGDIGGYSPLFQIVRNIESSNGANTAISPAGAAGPMQVMPGTAREIAVELKDAAFPTDGSDADVQRYLMGDAGDRYGQHYLSKQLKAFGGDTEAALVAYNAGPAVARKWLAAGKDMSVLPAETRDYLAKADGQMNGGALAPQAADLAYDDRVSLYARISDAQQKMDAEEEESRKARASARKDDLDLTLEAGGIVTGQDVLNDPDMDNGQKAELLRKLRAADDKTRQDHKSALKEQSAARKGDLDFQIQTGAVTSADGIVNDPLLDSADKAELLRKLGTEGEKRVREVERLEKARAAVREKKALKKIADDVLSIEESGNPVVANTFALTPDLPADVAADWLAKRDVAQDYYRAMNGIEQTPENQIRDRVDRLRPTTGQENYKLALDSFTKADKRAREIIKQRRTDPASAVEQASPAEFENLIAAAEAKEPGARRALVDMRLAKQDALGIAEAVQQPLTNAEAQRLADRLTLFESDPRALKSNMTGMFEEFKSDYGSLADEVAAQVLRVQGVDRQSAILGAALMRKMGVGTVEPIDARNLDTSMEIGASEKAMDGEPVPKPKVGGRAGPQPAQQGQGGAKQPQSGRGAGRPVGGVRVPLQVPAQPKAQPNAAQLVLLRKNPDLAPQFDAKFGQGAAAKAMAPQGDIVSRVTLQDGSIEITYADGWVEVYAPDGSVSAHEEGKK